MTDAASLPPGAIDADFEAWDPWTPAEAAAVLGKVRSPWYVAAGWAIDLFLGGEHRAHDDLEICVPGIRFGQLASAFVGYDLFVAGGIDDRPMVWPVDGARDTLDEHHQTWVRERATGSWKLDLIREPSRDSRWVFRRDPEISMDYADLILRSPDGIPYARPEVALLFKAKHQRPKDEVDFDAVLPHLDSDARAWLRSSLAQAHPGHTWLARLN